MHILAKGAGLEIADVIFDSNEEQFWASEQYLRGISLSAPNSYGVNPKGSIFSKAQIRRFRAKAKRLNREGDADQACFYLYKA
jgi:hypothetical protein